jgi:hypothetical protein
MMYCQCAIDDENDVICDCMLRAVCDASVRLMMRIMLFVIACKELFVVPVCD